MCLDGLQTRSYVNDITYLRGILDFSIKQADKNDEFFVRGPKIKGQRWKFDNILVSVCVTTIEQILFIAI